MTLSDFLIEIAKNQFQYQRKDGSFPGGHNGPYYDDETPVRNSGHWLITFSRCYEITNKDVFKRKVADIAEYLCSDEVRPHSYTYYHRKSENKNFCNSLIGQAWTIEALLKASDILNVEKYRKIAEEVFLLHPFLTDYGLWRRVEVNGDLLTIDRTFNHQLWFAACSSLIKNSKDKIVTRRIKLFLDNIYRNLIILKNGLIFHKIQRFMPELYLMNNNFKVYLLEAKKKIKEDLYSENFRKRLTKKSIGYHSFNLYAFTILKNQFPEHGFWNSGKFKNALSYISKTSYIDGLKNNKYGFPYNPPGFEIPYALQYLSNLSLEDKIVRMQYWLKQQLKINYNHDTKMFDKNTQDSLTLTARIYELTRLPKFILNKDII